MPDSQRVRRWAAIRYQESRGREDDSERGRKAYLVDGEDFEVVLIFCPRCAEREFGDES